MDEFLANATGVEHRLGFSYTDKEKNDIFFECLQVIQKWEKGQQAAVEISAWLG